MSNVFAYVAPGAKQAPDASGSLAATATKNREIVAAAGPVSPKIDIVATLAHQGELWF